MDSISLTFFVRLLLFSKQHAKISSGVKLFYYYMVGTNSCQRTAFGIKCVNMNTETDCRIDLCIFV